MRHRKAGRRLGRKSSHRKAMMNNLLSSLIKHERITTTLGRAKELKIIADKIITLAKKNTSASITSISRQIISEREIVIDKLLKDLGPRFKERNGGYTRIIKLGYRRGDGAPTAIVEYLGEDESVSKMAKKAAPAPKVEEKVEAAVETAPQTEEKTEE